METVIIQRTGQAPLRVRGALIASASSTPDTSSASYSGGTGWWQDVAVYRTATGRYVVALSHHTQGEGGHDTDEAAVYPGQMGCIGFLSARVPSWMLFEVMEQLDEDDLVEVEP